MVIKIDYRTEGEPTDDILKRGSLIKKEYEECREWYQDIPGFVPEEYHFIGKSPRGGHPALFTLQEYLGKGAEVRDIFREIGKEEFLREIKNDPVLAHDFRTLVPRMESLYETQGRIIDTVGPKNVSLVETPAGKRLVLLDPHITSLPTEPNQRKEKMKNLEADLQYLKEILDEIGSQEGTNDSRFQQAA